MKTISLALLWIGLVLLIFAAGSFAATHRVGGSALVSRSEGVAACKARQAILSSVDRSAWTDAQRASFDDICAVPSFRPGTFDIQPDGAVMALILVSGTLLYLIAIIRDGLKGPPAVTAVKR